MNIELPESFEYNKNPQEIAYVKNGVLYIDGHFDFQSLMYKLTYEIHGAKYCGYCGKYMHKEERTIDHKFPLNYGGVSITNNLMPSCRRCNNILKGVMTFNQFKHWKSLGSKKEKNKYRLESILINEKRIEKGELVFPKEWITDYDITEILSRINLSDIVENDKYQRNILEYYNRCHQYKQPIIVSANGWLFYGRNILCHAKKYDIHSVKAILLENVVKVRKKG